ncbi:MAG: DNA-binding response regulator [Planctomycetota bacterium]|nr:response regulator transcription factor [Gemmataceae bacterium]RLS55880.1 MAG: DNA-binding response regulator [Planctomycetota bacterium]MBJ7345255.1 response regulator transcription factor [Gemmataceae bacterium]MBJ7430201.1 response regulator transcription factor [Gemmataceae bacterium]MBJ7496387.1 response regulator transcription factor [Gemmataceae bacterium]
MKDVKKQAPLKAAPAPKVKNGIKVLVIEDEKALVDALVYNLDREGYEVTVAHEGQDGLRKAQAIPDIILLDIMLPGINGIEILRELRGNEKTKSIPVIVVSAKSEETDQVVGFSMGADDYVTKPFSVKILLQRIKALQRRSEVSADESTVELIEHKQVKVDMVRHKAFVLDQELDLTPTEFRLLECLLRSPGRAFSRQHLMDSAIGEGAIVLERTIDVHIKTLRKKLGAMDMIETVRGLGYRFKE